MDIKGLTTQIGGKNLDESNTIRPSVASSDHAPYSGNPLSPQTIKAIQAVLQSLQLGKVFDVIVTRVEGSQVTLQIPGAPADTPVLQAEMKSPPPLGTRLTLQLGDELNKPQLRVIATPNSPQDMVSSNLRIHLQHQQAMPPLLANLAQLSKNPARLPTDMPVEILDTARQFVEQLPTPNKLSVPQGLKQALQQSGPYLEAILARQKPVDTKTLPAKLPEQYIQSSPARPTAKQPETPVPDKQSRFEMATYTLQTLSRAMREQPVQDLRANLLRLATVIRAASELYRLQKTAFQQVDEFDNTKNSPQANKPLTPPLPESLTTPKPPGRDTPAPPPAATGKPAAESSPPPPTNQAIRSQTPQVQSQAQASISALPDTQSIMDELLGQVEGALTRIHVQQLQTAATDQQHRPVWVMELPVRTEQGIDLFDIRIQRDRENHAADDPNAPWTVSLAFDLDKLGAIRAQVSLYGEDRVSTTFWAEQAETSTYFNQHLDKLASRLKQVGLDVSKIDCRCGKPDAPPPSAEPRLVDEKV